MDELNTSMDTMELVEDEHQLKRIAPLEAERHKYVLRYEHAERTAKYTTDLAMARSDLSTAKRQYSYLRQQARHADAAGDAARGEDDREDDLTCPVCLAVMGRERSVPKCAHSLCTPCAERIMRGHGGKFVCPICREESTPSMASELRWEDGSSAGSEVKGSWGTKVTSIVEEVQRLPAGEKCLIFSQWDDMLSLIGRALRARKRRRVSPAAGSRLARLCAARLPAVCRGACAAATAQVGRQWNQPRGGDACLPCRAAARASSGGAGHWTRASHVSDAADGRAPLCDAGDDRREDLRGGGC